MSSDDDSQLKDLVSHTLESKGILCKLRAELRANVFLALEGNEKFKEQLRKNNKVIELLNTDEGVLALCIVEEFLEFCELKFTQTVLESEIGVPSDQIKSRGRQQLMNELKLNQENSKVPVLCQLLASNQQIICHPPSNSFVQNNKQSSLESHDNRDSSPSHNGNKLLNGGENGNNRLKSKTRAPDEQLILNLNLSNMNGSQEDEHSTNPLSPLLLDHLPPLMKPSPNLIANSKLVKTINDLEIQPSDQGNKQSKDIQITKEAMPEEKARSPSHKMKGDGDTGSVSEIEEDLDSADDLLNSSGSLRDDVTQDNSISTLSSGIGDYIEDVNKVFR